jgi:hypothetical protein
MRVVTNSVRNGRRTLRGLTKILGLAGCSFLLAACSASRDEPSGRSDSGPSEKIARTQQRIDTPQNVVFRITGVKTGILSQNDTSDTLYLDTSWDNPPLQDARVFACGAAFAPTFGGLPCTQGQPTGEFHVYPDYLTLPSTGILSSILNEERHIRKTVVDLSDLTAELVVDLDVHDSPDTQHGRFTLDVDLVARTFSPRIGSTSGAVCGFRHNGVAIGPPSCTSNDPCGGFGETPCDENCAFLSFGWELCYQVEFPGCTANLNCTTPSDHPFCPGVPGQHVCQMGNYTECRPKVTRTPLTGNDSDGDGLLDRWEANGIDGDCDGTVDIDFPALRSTFPAMANVNHKDLFLELDVMQDEEPMTAADIAKLKDAFAQAPVDTGGVANPDGLPGINLWIDTINGDNLGGGTMIPATPVAAVVANVGGRTLPYILNGCCGDDPEPGWNCPTDMPLLDCRFEKVRWEYFSDPCCTTFGLAGSPNYDSLYGPICPEATEPPRNCTQNRNFRELAFFYGMKSQHPTRSALVEDSGPSGSCDDGMDQRADGLADFRGAAGLPADPDCANNPFGAEDGGRPMSCIDGVDGDGADRFDTDCVVDIDRREYLGVPGQFGPAGSCRDGVDQNMFGDGADALDPDCAGLPAGEDGFGPPSCFDGIDNGGGDGADGADTDCPGLPRELATASADSCTNRSTFNHAVEIDDDGDRRANWADPGCASLPQEDSAGPNSCWDGIDNGDGGDSVDRTGDCFIGATGEDGSADPKTCVDGKDNAADGADNLDPECLDAMGAWVLTNTEDGDLSASCSDDRDNGSADGIDEADPDCLNAGVYDPTRAEDGVTVRSCADGKDNAADGADYGDKGGDCPAPPTEDGGGPLSCFDNRDNQEDGAKDDLDPDCAGVPAGVQEDGAGAGTCADGKDNSADNLDGTDLSCLPPGGQAIPPWGFFLLDPFAAPLLPTDLSAFGPILMHEFGHLLGLDHGGPAELKVPNGMGGFDLVAQPNAPNNCKPNYVSVMNYMTQFGIRQAYDPALSEGPGAVAGTCGDLTIGADEDGDGFVNAQDPQCYAPDVWDYSPPRRDGIGRGSALPTLVENALIETSLLDPSDSWNLIEFRDAANRVRLVPTDGYDPARPEDPAAPVANSCGNGVNDDVVDPADRADPQCRYYDYNADGVITAGAQRSNVNNGPNGACFNTSSDETLLGADDWRNLRMASFAGGSSVNFAPEREVIPDPEQYERETWQTDLGVALVAPVMTVGIDTPGVVVAAVQNHGPRQAESARATLVLYGGLTFDSLPDFCTEAANTATCHLGRLHAGDLATLDFTVLATSGGTARGVMVSAEPFGATDPKPSNNAAIAGVNVLPVAVFEGGEVECTSPTGAVVTLDGSGSYDPDGSELTYEWSAPGITFTNGDTATPTAQFPFGPTTVTLTVTNELGLSDSAVGLVEVVDHTRPQFTFVPADITSTNCNLSNIGNATGTDLCSNPVIITKNAPSKFPPGTTTVTWTIRDQRGNQGTATQLVTMVMGDDPACCPAGTNIIQGNSTNNVLNGTNGADCILGKGAQDTINGNGGNDYISGGDGDDIINPGLGNDVVFGGTGQDNVSSSSGNDYLSGGDGDDTLAGGANDDTCYGGQGQDTLKGEDGNDRLYGDVGFDNLQGGAGSDILTGGSETDSCTDSGGGSVTAQCEGGAPNACINGVEDGIETDTDCGGGCPRCASGFGCRSAADCVTALYCVNASCSSF